MLQAGNTPVQQRAAVCSGTQDSRVEIAELVLKYLQALAWPGIVLTPAVVFRRQLADVFKRVTRLETVAGSVEFAEQALEARENAQDLVDGDSPPEPPAEPTRAGNNRNEASAGAGEGDGEAASNFGEVIGLGGLRKRYPRLTTAHDYLQAALLITTSPIGAVGLAASTLEMTLMSVLRRHPGFNREHMHGRPLTLGRLVTRRPYSSRPSTSGCEQHLAGPVVFHRFSASNAWATARLSS